MTWPKSTALGGEGVYEYSERGAAGKRRSADRQGRRIIGKTLIGARHDFLKEKFRR